MLSTSNITRHLGSWAWWWWASIVLALYNPRRGPIILEGECRKMDVGTSIEILARLEG
jgi:hypothetical protein